MVRLEGAGRQPRLAQRPQPFQGGPVGHSQGHPDLGPPHFICRHPQEVAGGQVVVEDHQDGGNYSVVVQGPVGGVVAQVGGDGAAIVVGRTARRSHSRKKGFSLPCRRSTPKASGRTE